MCVDLLVGWLIDVCRLYRYAYLTCDRPLIQAGSLANLPAISDIIACVISEINGSDSAEVGCGIYCSDKVKCEHIL